MQDFMNPYDVIEKHGATLPHWQQGTACVFVTWRLADSLPVQQMREWKRERSIWLSKYPLPWDLATWKAYSEQFPERMEQWLDRGLGTCLLRNVNHRSIVSGAFEHFESVRYNMQAYVIMPNHLHLLVQLREGELLEEVLHSWKSYTAKEINKQAGGTGSVWQQGYWDRLIRSREHFGRSLRYIRENPEKAGLDSNEFECWQRAGL